MKKIIYIGFEGSVFNSQVLGLLEEISKSKYKVYLITNSVKMINNDKIQVHYMKKYPGYPLINILNLINIYKIFIKIRLCENTIIHVRSDIWGANVSRLINMFFPKFKNLLVDVRGVTYEEMKYYHNNINNFLKSIKLKHFIRLRKQYKKISYWSVVSPSLKKYVYNLTNKTKNIWINPSVSGNSFIYDQNMRNKIRNKYKVKENEILFVFSSGGAHKWQNIDNIINYFKESPSKIKLLLLTKKIYNNPDIINVFVDYSDMYKYLSAADIGIIFRDNNIINKVASPVKFSEYISCGLPVIADKNVGLISEIISNRKIGVLVNDIYDINDQTIEYLLQMQRSKISQIGYAIFNVKNIAENYINIYNQIIDDDLVEM